MHQGEVESKLMDGLLTGINRAFPYVKTDRDLVESHVETIYKVVHLVNMNVAIQALSLLYHITQSRSGLPDRLTFHDSLILIMVMVALDFIVYCIVN